MEGKMKNKRQNRESEIDNRVHSNFQNPPLIGWIEKQNGPFVIGLSWSRFYFMGSFGMFILVFPIYN